MRFFIFGLFLSVQIIYGSDAGIEILKNGTFKNDSSWYLAVNGDASAKHVFENNMLSVSITTPGSESWFIQLTQNKVNIKKDKRYILSFEIKSSLPRSILTSVCKDGGDYLPYSLRDTVKIDTSFFSYSQDFLMVQPTDSVARVELNFGLFKGDIQLKNVSLIECFEPSITFTGIAPQDIAFSDEPIKLSWSSTGLLNDTLKLSISYDNGLSWSVIKSNLKAVDSLEWIPGSTPSPWCLFKLATIKTSTVTTTPLEITQKVDLINNESFSNSCTDWVLTADTPGVQTTMVVQNSTLIVSSAGNGTTKISQLSIKLNKDDLYELFFTCYSKSSYQLKISLSNCIVYTDQRSDTIEKTISIDTIPNRYSILFKATKTVTNGELRFTMDKPVSGLSLSKISLVNASPPASVRSYARSVSQIRAGEQFHPVFLSGIAQSRIPDSGAYQYFNLSGKKISGKYVDQINYGFRGSGVIIIVPVNNDRTKQTGQK